MKKIATILILLILVSCGSKKTVEKRKIDAVKIEQTDSITTRKKQITENKDIDNTVVMDIRNEKKENSNEDEKITRIVEKFDSVGKLDTRWITISEKTKSVSIGVETTDKSTISKADKTTKTNNTYDEGTYRKDINDKIKEQNKIDNETDGSKGIQRTIILVLSIAQLIVIIYILYIYFKLKGK